MSKIGILKLKGYTTENISCVVDCPTNYDKNTIFYDGESSKVFQREKTQRSESQIFELCSPRFLFFSSLFN